MNHTIKNSMDSNAWLHGEKPASNVRQDTKYASRNTRCAGQVMIFVLMALLLLSVVIVWNFDLHNVVHLKMRAQNAADASALAAARWQGITLNLIGDLNIMQALSLSAGDAETARQIADTQARLCYAGPLVGLMAAQQAAKNNGIYANSSFTERLAAHAGAVLSDYGQVFAEPYEDCWQEYASTLRTIANSGIAAAPDNAALYTDYSGEHLLLDMNFYDAVAGREWCWFYWNAFTLLQTYADYQSWPPLPPQIQETRPDNSEVFSLGLATAEFIPGGLSTIPVMNQLRSERNLSQETISNFVAVVTSTWYIYEQSKWTDWSTMKDSSFPVYPEKNLKPQYDYLGADAVTRIEADAERLMPGATDKRIFCTAAAKPFGSLTGSESQVTPNYYSIVLPSFSDVRLIPVDAASGGNAGAYDLAWRDHIEFHLPSYMTNGLNGIDLSCWYCQQLAAWEDAAFRQKALDWLDESENPCVGESQRGTRRGH